jgi:hypothetical protein
MAEDQKSLSKEEAEEVRKGQNHPGTVPGEGSGPAEADPSQADDVKKTPPEDLDPDSTSSEPSSNVSGTGEGGAG